MGASLSSSSSSSSPEVQEQESLAASTGSLPFLRSAFSNLSHPSQSNSIPFPSLQQAFSLNPNPNLSQSPQNLPNLLSNLGPSIASLLFEETNPAVSWIDFLKGYNKCCARMPASSSLNLLFKLYCECCERAEFPCKLEFDSESDKVGGAFTPSDLMALLLMCWIMEGSWRVGEKKDVAVAHPDLAHLVASALVSCGEVADDEKIWECDVLGVGRSVSAQKVQMWAISSAPGLANCLPRFVQEKIKACAAGSSGDSVLSTGDNWPSDVENAFLLTCGTAWAISLTLRSNLCEELAGMSFPELVNQALNNILYRPAKECKKMYSFYYVFSSVKYVIATETHGMYVAKDFVNA